MPDDGTDGSDLYALTGMSYDNTGDLNARTWRHVAFIEDVKPHGSATAAHGGQSDRLPAHRPARPWAASPRPRRATRPPHRPAAARSTC